MTFIGVVCARDETQHGEEGHKVFGCMDMCIAELAKAVTIVHDVTSYL